MDGIIALILSSLLGMAVVGSFLYFIIGTLAESFRRWQDRAMLKYSGTFDRSLRSDYEKYFIGRMSYYEKLPEQLRVKFLLRVRSFVRSKTFESRGQVEITEEMKVMIAASAIQLTMGLTRFILNNFSRIIIYPDSYYSKITGEYHMGEANPRGIIVLSWKDFLKGYEDPSDTYNVGLHEMAHALELNQLLGTDVDDYFSLYFDKFKLVSSGEYNNLRDSNASFFRKYAGTNRKEFFAVCIETFFEASEEFRQELPKLYHHLCILLNQDPLSPGMQLKPLRWNKNAMLDEAQSLPELLVTRYSSVDIALSFLPAVFAVLFIYMTGIFQEAIFPVLAAGSIPLVVFTFRMNKLVMYEKYIAVQNPFGKIKTVLPLEGIAAIDFRSDRIGEFMRVYIAHEGRLTRYSHSFCSRSDDLGTLIKLLKEKEVVVKDAV